MSPSICTNKAFLCSQSPAVLVIPSCARPPIQRCQFRFRSLILSDADHTTGFRRGRYPERTGDIKQCEKMAHDSRRSKQKEHNQSPCKMKLSTNQSPSTGMVVSTRVHLLHYSRLNKVFLRIRPHWLRLFPRVPVHPYRDASSAFAV